jgi:diaminopimelate epimerase|tara:strand:- start:41 stop:877 length:837 start_codon:yes stop_codon:yes gene_type:complete
MNKDTNQIMALLNAYRMNGLGNNFLIIDRRNNAIELSKDKIVSISNMRIVPFDQLITLEKDEKNKYPIKIFNPDGIEVTACGNGARCIAYLIFNENKQKNISIKTKERILTAEIVGKQNVKINMGKPKFGWEEVPLSEEMSTKEVIIDFLDKKYGYGFCINVGNPHIVFFVKDCSGIDIKKLGPKIENYKFFPERTNVTFAQVLDKRNIKVNVWERGAGQTKACGTAACAVAVAASIKGLTDKNLQIHFKEGNLQIDYQEEIFMAGPVSEVKEIKIDI